METNSCKCHLTTNKQFIIKLKIKNINSENSTCEKLLGVIVDYKVYFSEHLDAMTKKTSGRASPIFLSIGFPKRSNVTNSFFTS